MSKSLRVLIVEDSEDDALLVLRELERDGYKLTSERVETPEAMKAALDRQEWDVVLSDYKMPKFSGPAALQLLKESGLDLPFIIISGTIGEETAVEAMRAGAHDYLMKGKLKRLVPAVERELREAEVRRERKQGEEALYQSERELKIRNQINQIFLTIPDDKMYAEVLKLVLDALESEYGTFGYFSKKGNFVAPAVTRKIYWEKCNVPEKDIIFEKGTFGGIWGMAIKEEKTRISNEGPFSTPEGHVAIKNTMATPIIYRGAVISAFHVANKATGYDEEDKALLETIANHVAPVLYARLERDKKEKELKKRVEELEKFHEFVVGRELKMVELKKEIERLKREKEKGER